MDNDPGRGRPRWSWPLALAVASLVLVGLTVVNGFTAAGPRPGARLILALVGLVVLFVSATALLAERHHRRVRRDVEESRGLAVIDAVPPGTVVLRLLDQVYGPNPENRDLVQLVLRGGGTPMAAAAPLPATRVDAEYVLDSEAPGSYWLTQTLYYRFNRPVPDCRLVIFETSSQRLRDLFPTGCALPLFDWVYIPDDESFLLSVEHDTTVDVGVRYTAADGTDHEAELQEMARTFVPVSEWPDYFLLFRRDIGSQARLDIRDYVSKLRIFTVDCVPSPHPSSPWSRSSS